MNKRCLYCYGELEDRELDFHPTCAVDFFGCEVQTLSDQFIVKPSNCCGGSLSSDAALIEAVAMRLARAALILTVPASLVRINDGGVGYAAKIDNNIEPFEQLIGTLDGCEFDNSTEMIAELIEEFSTISRLDVVNFFEQVLFLWIMGCSSVSLCSFALSRPNAGVRSLSPLIGVPSAFGGRDEVSSESFGLTINEKSTNICRLDFESAMRYMGLKDRIIRITIEKMINSKEQWFAILDSAPIKPELKSLFTNQIKKRLAILSSMR